MYVLKFILNFKKKIKNFKYIYDGFAKIDFNFQHKNINILGIYDGNFKILKFFVLL